MKIEKFKFGKGVSTEKDGAWKKEYIELTCVLPENATDKDFQDQFTAAEYIIDNLLVGVAGTERTEKPAAPGNPLLMTFEEIEAQDWKASTWVRKDDPDRKARLGEDAYMPTLVADKRLVEMIKQSPNSKLRLPPYDEITFAGDGGLIVRKVKKAKRAK